MFVCRKLLLCEPVHTFVWALSGLLGTCIFISGSVTYVLGMHSSMGSTYRKLGAWREFPWQTYAYCYNIP